jgi:RNA polymerase sigma factor (sigma-70 family)
MLWLSGKKHYKELQDTELIALYRKKGDRKAMGALFERYAHLVYSVCLKYFRDDDASRDATLQVFEKTMKDLQRFEVEKFSAWIHRVARNHCLMELRGRRIMIPVDEEDGISPDRTAGEGFSTDPEVKDETEARLALLEEAVRSLNEEQRICIELFYIKKHSYQDVSEIAGFSLNEVKSHIQNGKRNLKQYMLKKNHELYR